MPEAVAQPESSVQPLNEGQRIVDVFIAPSKLGRDIQRSAAWWGPVIILILISTAFTTTVTKKVGWETVYDNNMKMVPKVKEMVDQRMATLPPAQVAQIHQQQIRQQEINSYLHPLWITIIFAISALLVWPTINFGFGGTAKYSRIFTVFMYTAIISDGAKFLLAIVALYAGLVPDAFNIQNPVGTNIGYYLAGGDSPLWLISLTSSVDILGIWALAAASIGCAVVAKVKTSSAAIAVVGWFVLFILLITGVAAAFAG